MPIQVYEVLREHHGDKAYAKGDERVLDASAAQHLVRLGVLAETDRAPPPPVADPLTAATSEAERLIAVLADRVKAAEAAAADQIGALDKRVDEARADAEARLNALSSETDVAMKEMVGRRGDLEAELQALEQKIAGAKAEAASLNKAEGKAPANKADKA